MSLVVIKTFADSLEANICKGQLEAEGIKCFVNNEGITGANPLLANAVGGFQLCCSEENLEKALKILED